LRRQFTLALFDRQLTRCKVCGDLFTVVSGSRPRPIGIDSRFGKRAAQQVTKPAKDDGKHYSASPIVRRRTISVISLSAIKRTRAGQAGYQMAP
jgi:hypothetical protein